MNEMLKAITDFYSIERGERSVVYDRLFVYSEDYAHSEMRCFNWRQVWIIRIQILTFNIIEFLKSSLKTRLPAYRYVNLCKVAFGGDTYISFNNGTVVICNGKYVQKFFFKDITFFAELYGAIAPLAYYETIRDKNFFSIKQPCYRSMARKMSDAELLVTVKPKLERYHDFKHICINESDKFSPLYKVKQIIGFYYQEKWSGINEYLKLAKDLGVRSESFRKVLCHGDLWRENILEDHCGEVVLIDFDKTLFFCEGYDYVYFFLMDRVLSSRVYLEEILQNIDYYAEAASKFFHEECKGQVGVFGVKEIRFCIYMFVLLKFTEQDLRHEKYGQSISMLRTVLAKI